jgi:hypothetical protein
LPSSCTPLLLGPLLLGAWLHCVCTPFLFTGGCQEYICRYNSSKPARFNNYFYRMLPRIYMPIQFLKTCKIQ